MYVDHDTSSAPFVPIPSACPPSAAMSPSDTPFKPARPRKLRCQHAKRQHYDQSHPSVILAISAPSAAHIGVEASSTSKSSASTNPRYCNNFTSSSIRASLPVAPRSNSSDANNFAFRLSPSIRVFSMPSAGTCFLNRPQATS